ncbi:hypothetical protein GCM10009827_000580 [Dactylosporangium maewongense]|uniref:Uncharacterized protein n=1 Tax=Dactylosporangium maewongense TaxID=634393 RepID=A0ABN1ZIA6_9ACTN
MCAAGGDEGLDRRRVWDGAVGGAEQFGAGGVTGQVAARTGHRHGGHKIGSVDDGWVVCRPPNVPDAERDRLS